MAQVWPRVLNCLSQGFIRAWAKHHGFIDPIHLLAQLERFTQPASVREPIELLRAGALFHARGLINSRVIQHNLDWVWPYWVEQQYNPLSAAFIPRAFSLTHVNLTHRNWTALGLPHQPDYPIVDPRGLCTPHYDGFSVDIWLRTEQGQWLLPSRSECCQQQLRFNHGLSICTHILDKSHHLKWQQQLIPSADGLCCQWLVHAYSHRPACVYVVLRPYNPEGVHFIHHWQQQGPIWWVNKRYRVVFQPDMAFSCVSDYAHGDVLGMLKHLPADPTGPVPMQHHCPIGLVTAAAAYPLTANRYQRIEITVPLQSSTPTARFSPNGQWQQALRGAAEVDLPNDAHSRLFKTALRTLVLFTGRHTVPGPYTYKRFWYRDATFSVYALLKMGLFKQAQQALQVFPQFQQSDGYFRSQTGEWDSNGQVLWIFYQYQQFSQQPLPATWQHALEKGTVWLQRQLTKNPKPSPHAGLLPAGFSAEHLGPVDYFYWDNYWALAGLQAARCLAPHLKGVSASIDALTNALNASLQAVTQRLGTQALPASPYRRLDAGAIGSLVASYPLQLLPCHHPALQATLHFLMEHSLVKGCFFQDMTHSGLNAYLSLQLAQCLLRAQDARFYSLLQQVANLASPTGQWPEAVHPHTLGGCMGDGQHAWAAAEWLLLLRACFIQEEGQGLILGSGLMKDWWQTGRPLRLSHAPTPYGFVSVQLQRLNTARPRLRLSWQARWHGAPPCLTLAVPGFPRRMASEKDTFTEWDETLYQPDAPPLRAQL